MAKRSDEMDVFSDAFRADEVVGQLHWPDDGWPRVGMVLRHGCHLADLKPLLHEGSLTIDSDWKWIDPNGASAVERGIWFSFNAYEDNYFGPFEVHCPADSLRGRRFAVLKRSAGVYVLLETPVGSPYESLLINAEVIRIDSFLVVGRDGRFARQSEHVINVVLVTPLPVAGTTVWPVEHCTCTLNKCGGWAPGESIRCLVALGDRVKSSPEFSARYASLQERFPAWRDSVEDFGDLLSLKNERGPGSPDP